MMFYIKKYFKKYIINILLIIIFSIVSLGIGIATSLVLGYILKFIHPYLINILNSINVDSLLSSSMPYLYYAITCLVGFLVFSTTYFWLYGFSSRNKRYEQILSDIILPILSLCCFLYVYFYLIPPMFGLNLATMIVSYIRFILAMMVLFGMFYFIGGIIGVRYSNADSAYGYYFIIGFVVFFISFIILKICIENNIY